MKDDPISAPVLRDTLASLATYLNYKSNRRLNTWLTVFTAVLAVATTVNVLGFLHML
jgi:hypothetical protein